MSLWEKYNSKVNFLSLDKDIEVDILIVGGGIAGLTLLYYLKDMPNVCLVDASRIGCGVTQNTTGKLTYLQGVYNTLDANISTSVARDYLHSQRDAISLAKEIIEKEKIDCDLEEVESYLFADKEKDIEKVKKEKEFLERVGITVDENQLPLNVPSKYAISVKDTYVFNPIKYLNHLKELFKENQIYENTKVEKLTRQKEEYVCLANGHKIIAKKVIVACHYPFFIVPFWFPLKSHIEKSYMIACKTDKNKKFSCINFSEPHLSSRYYQDGKNCYQIYLANSHKTSVKQNDKENFERLKKIFVIQEKNIVAEWSNVDIITDDKLPYIGEVKSGLYMVTGFNAWGMTNGILAAKIVSDVILGKSNPYLDLFSLKRHNFYKMKSFFSNTANTVVAFVGSKKLKKEWYLDCLEFQKINGKSVAIYTDENGRKHSVYTTCPHMKCSLIFNELEKTWDCPCHSSRFDLDGRCIKGPSLDDISYKEENS